MTKITTKLSPTKRNGAMQYLNNYLLTLTDWKTYAGAPPAEIPGKMSDVTAKFFSPALLKGAAALFAAHAAQQGSAAAVTIALRRYNNSHAKLLDTYHGVNIRQPQFKFNKHTLNPPARPLKTNRDTTALVGMLNETTNLEFLAPNPGTLKRLTHQKARDILKNVDEMYTLTEGGRTWLVYTFTGGRTLTVLTGLSLPNRSYYFDRTLPQNMAVDIATARMSAAQAPGFIGETNELDFILPFIRLAKILLYGLNWYLIDPTERDEGDDPQVGSYGDLNPPPLNGGWGQSGRSTGWRRTGSGYGTRYNSSRRTPGSARSRANNSYSPPPPPPPPPSPWEELFNAPPPEAYQQASFIPGYNPAAASARNVTPPNIADVNLQPSAVTVLVANANESELAQLNIPDGYIVVDAYGQPTGLGIAPGVVPTANGFEAKPDEWLVAHLETGLSISGNIRGLEPARQLAALLVAAVDWRKPLEQLTTAEKQTAELIANQFHQ